jgi:hypothetical protein
MMRESIRLEIPATLNSLPTARMVLGGVALRLDFSLEELEDLSLAATELFRAALDSERLDSWIIEMAVVDDALHLVSGPYRSADLRRRLEGSSEERVCLDLCRLLSSTVDSFEVSDNGEGFVVAMSKGRTHRT